MESLKRSCLVLVVASLARLISVAILIYTTLPSFGVSYASDSAFELILVAVLFTLARFLLVVFLGLPYLLYKLREKRLKKNEEEPQKPRQDAEYMEVFWPSYMAGFVTRSFGGMLVLLFLADNLPGFSVESDLAALKGSIIIVLVHMVITFLASPMIYLNSLSSFIGRNRKRIKRWKELRLQAEKHIFKNQFKDAEKAVLDALSEIGKFDQSDPRVHVTIRDLARIYGLTKEYREIEKLYAKDTSNSIELVLANLDDQSKPMAICWAIKDKYANKFEAAKKNFEVVYSSALEDATRFYSLIGLASILRAEKRYQESYEKLKKASKLKEENQFSNSLIRYFLEEAHAVCSILRKEEEASTLKEELLKIDSEQAPE